MTSFLASAIQLNSSADLTANFAAAEEQIELAVRRGAELVGLPENFAFMGEDSQRLEQAALIAEQAQRFLITMARRYQVTLMGGGYPVPAGAGLTSNRAQLVAKDGQILATYDKIHLFDVDLPDGNTYQESATVQPGNTLPPVVEVPGLCRVGLSICYDVRFPELYRHLAAEGASTGTWRLRVPICSSFRRRSQPLPARITGMSSCRPGRLKTPPMWSHRHKRAITAVVAKPMATPW